MEDDEEFWNTSGVKAFNFDDEESNNLGNSNTSPVAPASSTLESILAARPKSEAFLRPSMITCEGYDRIEQLVNYVDSELPKIPSQNPKDTIHDIVEGKIPIDLTKFKKKSEKLALLDTAICFRDGNVITAVTIFLYKTLKLSLFVDEIRKRPVAIDHFMSYLDMMEKTSEFQLMQKELFENPRAN